MAINPYLLPMEEEPKMADISTEGATGNVSSKVTPQ